jgi:hypothetical protein
MVTISPQVFRIINVFFIIIYDMTHFVCKSGGADNEILVWKANFVQVPDAADVSSNNKASVKTKIRPSIAGGLQGVDVKKIVASSVTEDRQDIEDASVNSKRSSSTEEVDLSKKTMEMQISQPLEQTGNENKTVVEIWEIQSYFMFIDFFIFTLIINRKGRSA